MSCKPWAWCINPCEFLTGKDPGECVEYMDTGHLPEPRKVCGIVAYDGAPIRGLGLRVWGLGYMNIEPLVVTVGSSVVNVQDNYLKIVPAIKTSAAIHPA